jgi:hypothetical protein
MHFVHIVTSAAAAGAVATAIAVAASPAPSPSPDAAGSPPPAIEIYVKAVHEMRALAAHGNPPYLVFDLTVDSHNLHWYPQTDNGKTTWEAKLVHANETSNYRVWYRSKDKHALVQDAVTHAAFKGESPFEPGTTDLSEVSGATPAPSASPSPGTKPTTTASGQVIGAITVNGSKYYDVQLVGVEDHAGHPVYHLHLRAYHDATKYPLTDLWVDTSDYRVWSVHGEVTIRAVAAAIGVGVTADFAPVDAYWLVSSFDFTMKGYVMVWHANTATTMRARIVSAPASLPESYFTP